MEMMVVIFIVVVGLVGVLSLANQNSQVQSVDRNSVIATQLAQEGLELVRNKRDMNWLQGGNWKTSSTTNSRLDIIQQARGLTYTVDAYTGRIGNAFAGISDPLARLYLNGAGFYTHQSGATSTIFSRVITSGNESAASTSIICLVQWKRGTSIYNFSAQTVLYNWR
jgi:type II secretory pathway pseudopilin PulG